MRSHRFFVGAVVFSSGLGCNAGAGVDEDGEHAESDRAAIVGGTVDVVHDAVVFLTNDQGYACTGTIIATNGTKGYTLTAAHCLGMQYVVQADDLACLNNDSCAAVWIIEEQVPHPSWSNDLAQGYDFSLARFDGADALTPIIPAANGNDGLAVGIDVDLIGYGATEFGANDSRRHVVMPVADLDPLFISFDQTGGQGVCSGDDGGPGILNGTVVGVTSFSDANCVDTGVSGRVEAVYTSFIAPYIGTAGAGGASGAGGAGLATGTGGDTGGGGPGTGAAGATGTGGASASATPENEDGGCNCALPGSPLKRASGLTAGVLVALALATRRRRPALR